MPPYCDEHQMYFRMAYVDGSPFEQCVCVKCESGRLSGFDLAQSAIKATESPSAAAADKGLILTEEELEEWEREPRELLPVVSDYRIKLLIFAYRSLNSRNAKLVLENDELMAENEKLKTALHEITQVDTDYFEDDAKLMTKFAEEALEELNHE